MEFFKLTFRSFRTKSQFEDIYHLNIIYTSLYIIYTKRKKSWINEKKVYQ